MLCRAVAPRRVLLYSDCLRLRLRLRLRMRLEGNLRYGVE